MQLQSPGAGETLVIDQWLSDSLAPDYSVLLLLPHLPGLSGHFARHAMWHSLQSRSIFLEKLLRSRVQSPCALWTDRCLFLSPLVHGESVSLGWGPHIHFYFHKMSLLLYAGILSSFWLQAFRSTAKRGPVCQAILILHPTPPLEGSHKLRVNSLEMDRTKGK